MGKACLAIGIENTAGLAPLPGAVNGAKQMAAWARAAGYDVRLVTDEPVDGKPRAVAVATIRTALMSLLAEVDEAEAAELVPEDIVADPPERLIIYFAGHGHNVAGSDVWLLPRSYKNKEAIGITQLQDLLKTYLPGKIAIISDACRDTAGTGETATLTPMPVLEQGPYDPADHPQIDIDQFFATARFSSAFMLRGGPDQPARCIFTSVLMEVLRGFDASCFDDQRTDEITSESIARYLRANVPLRSAGLPKVMRPQTFPCWLDPDTYLTRAELQAMDLPPLDPWPTFVAKEEAPAPAPVPPPPTAAPPAVPAPAAPAADIWATFGGAEGMVRGEMHRAAKAASGEASVDFDPWASDDGVEVDDPWLSNEERAQLAREREALREQMAALAERQAFLEARLARADRATHYETQCGLTVDGATLADPLVAGGPVVGARIVPDPAFAGSWRIEFAQRGPVAPCTPVLAPTTDGMVIATLAMQGYITDCIVAGEGCVASSLRPMWLDPSVRLRSERVIAGGDMGDLEPDEVLGWVAELRAADTFDPMLGVIAAYVFHRAGQTCAIRRLAPLYAARNLPLPYDIALLSAAPVVAGDDGTMLAKLPRVLERAPRTREQRLLVDELGACEELEIRVAGAFPIMRQGWFLLGAARPGTVPDGLAALAPRLKPAAFATLEADALPALIDCLEKSPWPS